LINCEYYDWNNLIGAKDRRQFVTDIDELISTGKYWKNSPPYQTDVNVFGLPGQQWNNLKMSFIWSCFDFMKQERQIKSIKSWGYKTNFTTQEDRNNYWHQHIREDSIVVSGVYYIDLPKICNTNTSGTELAHDTPEGNSEYMEWRTGNWIIFPGKTWHRPGYLEVDNWRYIVAADMEII